MDKRWSRGHAGDGRAGGGRRVDRARRRHGLKKLLACFSAAAAFAWAAAAAVAALCWLDWKDVRWGGGAGAQPGAQPEGAVVKGEGAPGDAKV